MSLFILYSFWFLYVKKNHSRKVKWNFSHNSSQFVIHLNVEWEMLTYKKAFWIIQWKFIYFSSTLIALTHVDDDSFCAQMNETKTILKLKQSHKFYVNSFVIVSVLLLATATVDGLMCASQNLFHLFQCNKSNVGASLVSLLHFFALKKSYGFCCLIFSE